MSKVTPLENNREARERSGVLQSFGRRSMRKLEGRKARLVEELLPTIEISDEGLAAAGLEVAPLFAGSGCASDAPVWLEIGFGGGEHLAAQAERHPSTRFIGCEVFMDGVAKLLMQLDDSGAQNIRLFTEDARILLEALPDASLERVFILFPDPWRKTRHHKRRIVNPHTLDVLHRVMKAGAELRLATDHVDYAEWMLEVMLADERFAWQAKSADDFLEPPADWVPTRYQQKAEREGRPARFFNFVRL